MLPAALAEKQPINEGPRRTILSLQTLDALILGTAEEWHCSLPGLRGV